MGVEGKLDRVVMEWKPLSCIILNIFINNIFYRNIYSYLNRHILEGNIEKGALLTASRRIEKYKISA